MKALSGAWQEAQEMEVVAREERLEEELLAESNPFFGEGVVSGKGDFGEVGADEGWLGSDGGSIASDILIVL